MNKYLVLVLLCGSAAVHGQQSILTQFHLSFAEVDAVTGLPVANPTGELNPGEAALVTLSVSFEPPVGTLLTNPALPPGSTLPPGEWKVHAFEGTSLMRIWSSTPVNGAWRNIALEPGWSGTSGNVASRGVALIAAHQEPEGADQSNPVMIWRAIWTPDDYAERTIRFAADHGFSNPIIGLFVQEESTAAYYWVEALSQSGHLDIPIVPWGRPCYANCDGSTTEPILTVDDFTCFIDEFAAALTLPHEQQVTHYANCDGSTAVPALTVDDFTCFINVFAQGCP